MEASMPDDESGGGTTKCKPLRIAIVGSGVAGSVFLHGLSQAPKYEVFCFEKVAANDYSQAGTGLNVSPNAITTLRHFYPTIADDIMAQNLPWNTFSVSLVTGEPLISFDMLEVADDPGVRVSWADLYDHCRKPVMDKITFATSVQSIEYEESGETLKITYTAGNDVVQHLGDLDLVVGADGRFSKVRQSFFAETQSKLCGMGVCRALFHDDGIKTNPLNDFGQWFNGPHRLLGFPLASGATYVTATFPIEPIDGHIPPEHKSVEGLYKMFTPNNSSGTTQLCEEARFILEGIAEQKDNLHWARFQTSDFQYQDERGHVLLLGDASHAMVPTLGQGATMAIEDACAAADSLRHLYDPSTRSGSVRRALLHYRERREARIQFCSDLSDDASDTLRPGTNVIEDTLRKAESPFKAQLTQLYRDVPKPIARDL